MTDPRDPETTAPMRPAPRQQKTEAAPADTAAAKRKRNRGPLGVVFVTLFLDLMGFGILIPIQPFYAERFGASPSVVTLIGASYSLMQFLFAPFWGRLSDRIGRRPVVLISIAMGGLGFLAFGFAGSLPMLFLARMLAGFGNANLGTVQAIVADVTTGEDRARGMGLIGAAFGLGFIFGPIIGGIVGSTLGAPATAFVAAGLCALNWIYAYRKLPETRKPQAPSHAKRTWLSSGALLRALPLTNVPPLLALFFLYTMGFSLMETSLGLFLEHRYVPASLIGTDEGGKQAARLTMWVLLTVGFMAAAVQWQLIGVIRKLATEKTLVLVGGACLVCGIIGYGLVDVTDAAYGYMFLPTLILAVGSSLMSPAQSALLSRAAPEHQQGEVLGVGQSVSSLGRIFGPSMSGLLFEQGRSWPFFIGAGLITAGVLVATSLKPPPRDPDDTLSPIDH